MPTRHDLLYCPEHFDPLTAARSLIEKQLGVKFLDQVPGQLTGIEDDVEVALFGGANHKMVVHGLSDPLGVRLAHLRDAVALSIGQLEPQRGDAELHLPGAKPREYA